jgi:hypothetical protein
VVSVAFAGTILLWYVRVWFVVFFY